MSERARMRIDEIVWCDDVAFRDYQKARSAINNARHQRVAKLRRERWGLGLMLLGSIGGGTCLLTGNYFWAALPVCVIAIGFLLLPN